ncbi:MAG: DNA-3-methyladenine glycosylase [Gemmatimonadota bacterium]
MRPEFYARSALDVARDLLGMILTREGPEGGVRVSGRIVETEAYTGADDPASHAAARIGRTERNDPLFGPPGTAYIHLNYGVHWCLNAVTGAEGEGSGVLIRALEPLEGLDTMRARREGRDDLTNGPARLTRALAIGPELQRHPLDEPPLVVSAGEPLPDARVGRTPRIGISRAADRLYRFTDERSAWLSR